MNESYNLCPVCGYNFKESLYDENGEFDAEFEICSSCGYEFGVTDIDLGYTFKSWRKKWIDEGMTWKSGGSVSKPVDWDPRAQLSMIGVIVDEGNKLVKDIEEPEWHWVPSEKEL